MVDAVYFGVEGSSPEERLWCAVLLCLYRDLEYSCQRAARELERSGAVSRVSHISLQIEIKHAGSDWIKEVCGFIGMDSRVLEKAVRILVDKYNLGSYPVAVK